MHGWLFYKSILHTKHYCIAAFVTQRVDVLMAVMSLQKNARLKRGLLFLCLLMLVLYAIWETLT